MSIDALRSTLGLERTGDLRAKHKAVLISLADHCNAAGETFLCVAQICDETWYERKAVLSAMTDLRAAGLIEDTGKRRGRTGQVIVWRMPFVEHRNQESRKRDSYREHDPQADSIGPESEQPRGLQAEGQGAEQSRKGNGSGNGTLSERVPKTDSKGPALEAKGSRKRDTEPSTRFNPPTGSNPPPEGDSARAREANDKAKPKCGKRLVPQDWEPDEKLAAWCAEEFPRVPMAAEVHRFRDRSWAEDRRFRDFAAAFRNWMRKAEEFRLRDRGGSEAPPRRYLS